MRLFLSFCYLYIFVYSKVKAEDEFKYIDLLPEKEKQEFLEKIARRIFEELEGNNVNKPEKSIEITEKQLDEHDQFVRRLIQEEQKNLRKHANFIDTNVNGTQGPPALREDEKTGNKYVDLTMRADNSRLKRENSRKVFTGFAESDNSTENGPGSDLDIQVKNFRRNARDTNETISGEKNNLPLFPLANKSNIIENNATTISDINTDVTQQQDSAIGDNLKSKDDLLAESKALNNVEKTENFEEISNVTQQQNSIKEDNLKNQSSLLLTEHKVLTEVENTENIKENTDTTETTKPDRIEETFTTDVSTSALMLKENTETTETTKPNKIEEAFTTDVSTSEPMQYVAFQKSFDSSQDNGEMNTNKAEDKDYSNKNITQLNTNDTSQENLKTEFDTDKEKEKNMTNTKNSSDTFEVEHINNSKIINKENTTSDINEETTQTTSSIYLLTTTPFKTEKFDEIKEKSNSRMSEVKNSHESYAKQNGSQISDVAKIFLSGAVKVLNEKLREQDIDNKVKNSKPMEYRVFEISSHVSPFVRKERPKTLLPQKKKESQKNKSKLEEQNLDQLKKSQRDDKQDLNQQQLMKATKNEEDVTFVQEEPYYAPVYNYRPRNAFYNPRNVYGPDSEDDGENIKEHGVLYLMLNSEEKLKRTQETNQNQLSYVPVYNFSSNNAFYNPSNNFLLNSEDINNELDKDEDNAKDYEIDIMEDKNDKGLNDRNHIEWQYYYDPVKKAMKSNNDVEKRGDTNGIEFKDIFKYGYAVHYNDLDWGKETQTPVLRSSGCKKEKEKDKDKERYIHKCSKEDENVEISKEEKEESKQSEEEDDLNENKTKHESTMSKVRHMMMNTGHFTFVNSFDRFNTTNLTESYFASAEKKIDNSKEIYAKSHFHYKNKKRKKKVKKNKDKSKKKHKNKNEDAHTYLRMRAISDDDNKHQQKQDTNLNSNDNIAADYFYGTLKADTHGAYAKQNVNFKNDKLYNSLKLVNDLKNTLLSKNKKKPVMRNQARSKQKRSDKSLEEYFKNNFKEASRDPEIIEYYLKVLAKYMRTGKEPSQYNQELDIYTEVLGDMIKENNKGLNNYDWLGTTVDLQSALHKMVDMVESVRNDEDLHPSDMELLKYLVFLHALAKDDLIQNAPPRPDQLRGMKLPLGKKLKPKIIKESGLLYRAWLIRVRPSPIPDDDLDQFLSFLVELQNSLYTLHSAVKYIATVSKYNDNRWLQNLKRIYFDTNKNVLLEVILHLSTVRLLGMVEESSKKGLEDNFLAYARIYEKEVEDTLKEFVFVLKLVQELKSIE